MSRLAELANYDSYNNFMYFFAFDHIKYVTGFYCSLAANDNDNGFINQ